MERITISRKEVTVLWIRIWKQPKFDLLLGTWPCAGPNNFREARESEGRKGTCSELLQGWLPGLETCLTDPSLRRTRTCGEIFCCHLDILHNLGTRGLVFSLFTEPHPFLAGSGHSHYRSGGARLRPSLEDFLVLSCPFFCFKYLGELARDEGGRLLRVRQMKTQRFCPVPACAPKGVPPFSQVGLPHQS